VLRQTHAEFELLVVDDGSTDGTGAVLDELARQDSRLRVISQDNRGMGEALNRGLDSARHDWIVRMDGDDVMLPHRIERQLAFLSQHPELVVASALVRYINEKGEEVARYDARNAWTDPATLTEALRSNIVVGFHHPAVIMHRPTILAAGGYRNRFWPVDDIDLWNRVLEINTGLLTQPEYLLMYRVHGGSVSIEKAGRARLMLEWMEACMIARRAGGVEPTLEAFLEHRRNQPWYVRMHARRRSLAHGCYKSAAASYANGSYLGAGLRLLASGLLEPNLLLRRALPRRSA
jgi:glycosyltransferase involved in cell wall biosynthesis